MSSKKIIYILMIIGSFIGGYLPVLWGGSGFSVASLFLSAIGGVIGVAVGYKLTN
jgi:hypothetical protein